MEISLPRSSKTMWNLRMTDQEITRMWGADHMRERRADIKRDLAAGTISIIPTRVGGHKLTAQNPKSAERAGAFALSRAQFGLNGVAPTTQKLWCSTSWNGQHANIVIPKRFMGGASEDVSETDQLKAAVGIVNKALASDSDLTAHLTGKDDRVARRLILKRTIVEEIS